MLTRLHWLLLPAILALPVALAQKAEPYQLRLIVPAYFYPSDQKDYPGAKAWARLIESHAPEKKIEILPIANVNSGQVGDKADPNYQRVIKAAAKKKMTVLAYLSTNYAKASAADVKKNAEAYLKLYPEIGGFFLDEQSSAAKDVAYYVDLCDYIRQKRKGAFIVGNPGTYAETGDYLSQKGMRVLDVVIMRENSAKDAPFSNYQNPKWAEEFRSDRIGVIFHTSEKMQYARMAREKKVGYIYVTDGKIDTKDTRYTQLPTYWTDELKAVAEVNSAK